MRLHVSFFMACAATAGGTVGAPAQDAKPARTIPLNVAVSIPPQAYFVEQIGGPLVRAVTLVQPGQSPHTFEPTPRQMAELSDAEVYFSIGVEFEKGTLPRIRKMFPKLEVVELHKDVPRRPLEHACEDHDHEGHDHAADGTDPHIWLSPERVQMMARAIHAALVKHDAANRAAYDQRLAAFVAEVQRVRDQIAEALAPLKGQEVFVFHPAFGYFLEEFGLRQVPVEIAGKEPTARQLAQLIERAKRAGVRVIFVQPQFSTKAAESVARSIGGVVVPMDPLAHDYLRNLEDMAQKVKSASERTPADEKS